jgi:transcriptional regulator GlxA family with amidase domain
MTKNLHLTLSVDALAARVATSPRTFARHFREQTGTTPLQWLHTARVRRAQELLETTALGIEEIANAVGFESSVTFRTCFRRVAGVSPTTYRRTFARRAVSFGPLAE